MDEAAAKERWNHTASLMALLANINRDPNRNPIPYFVDDFHPLLTEDDRFDDVPDDFDPIAALERNGF